MLFINTRPTSRASILSQGLQQEGISVFELPLLEMVAKDISNQQKQLVNQLSIEKSLALPNVYQALVGYDVLVVVSPTAAELGSRFLTKNAITLDKKTIVIAVGDKTAAVLAEYAIEAVTPEDATSEGILALPCIKSLNAQHTAMVWRGQGGRELLIDDLTSRCIKVDVIEWYYRQFPKNTLITFTSLLQTNYYIQADKQQQISVLISSGEAFKHWQELLTPHLLLEDFNYIVLGTRLANLLDEHNLSHQVINSLCAKQIKASLIVTND